GPLGIIMMMWYKIKYEGLRGGLSFIILISFSLAFVNLLPLPVLDGGHITYALIEVIIRRRIPTKIILFLQNLFAILLISLMLYICFFDGKRVLNRLLPAPKPATESIQSPPSDSAVSSQKTQQNSIQNESSNTKGN
ncbi:MAG: site-2 protease family protein, partial [Lentisphaeria bacterium]